MKKLITLTLLVILNISFAQNLQEIETELLLLFRQIKVYPTDSLDIKNATFQEKLLEYTSKIPETINYPFDSLKQESLNIATSADGKFRIYSWNTHMGGTMHDYSVINQHSANESIYSNIPKHKKTQHSGSICTQIHTLKTIKDTFYLPEILFNYSSKDFINGLTAYRIKNNQLVDSISLFKCKSFDIMDENSDSLYNFISIEYDFFSVVDRQERPITLITYNEEKQTIKLPIIEDHGKVTDQFETYRFNGKYFELVD